MLALVVQVVSRHRLDHCCRTSRRRRGSFIPRRDHQEVYCRWAISDRDRHRVGSPRPLACDLDRVVPNAAHRARCVDAVCTRREHSGAANARGSGPRQSPRRLNGFCWSGAPKVSAARYACQKVVPVFSTYRDDTSTARAQTYNGPILSRVIDSSNFSGASNPNAPPPPSRARVPALILCAAQVPGRPR